MATAFEAGSGPSPGFFADNFQTDNDASNLFDQAFGADAPDAKLSAADPFDVDLLPTAPAPTKPTYAYPSLDCSSGLSDPYRHAAAAGRGAAAAALTPPASHENSPTAWPLEMENPSFGATGRAPAPGPLPTLQTHDTGASFGSHFGQVTPPDDSRPRGADFARRRAAAEPAEPEPEPEPRATGRGAGRKAKAAASTRASKAPTQSQSQSQSQTQPKPARRRPRKGAAAPPAPAADGDADEEMDPKRSVFLERNRVAAYKCRQKKKEQVRRMEDDCRDLARQKGARLLELEQLNKEYFALKSLLLEHARGGCARARTHLQRMLAEDRRRGDLAKEMLGMLRAEQAREEGGGAGDEAEERRRRARLGSLGSVDDEEGAADADEMDLA